MKLIKYIGQVLAAVIYTCILTGIMFTVITIPLAFILSLPWWGILIAVLLFGSIMEGIVMLIGSIGISPYVWIAKNNIIATSVSIILVLLNIGINVYRLWVTNSINGFWQVVFCIIASLLLLQFIFVAISGIVAAYKEVYDDK